MLIKNQFQPSEIGLVPTDWLTLTFKDICWVNQGLQIPISNRLKLPTSNSKVYITIQYLNAGKTIEYIDDYADSVCCNKEDILMTRTGNTGIVVSGVEGVFHNNFFKINFDRSKVDKDFLIYYLNQEKIKRIILTKAGISTIPDLNHGDFYSIPIALPPTKEEQTLIAVAIGDVDSLINSLEKLIFKKRDIKKGIIQKLLVPKKDWIIKKLGDFLDYEQPTNYIVTDTEYNENNQTPVLTAGKTFILGYTHEEFGIFKNFPVIIFDDFTTATKFVEFPFKVKSSAMKILKPKNSSVNLRLIYEIMKLIKYPMGIGDHKRHWIAEYQNIEISIPSTPEEQNHVAEILSDIDTEISTLEKKFAKLEMIKLGMMQNLLTGKIRLLKTNFPETKIHQIDTSKEIGKPKHNWEFNEAVLISVLAHKFATSEFPLGRKRYTKLSYLFHRYKEQEAEGYLKKAAGPYNPKTKYGGAEKIALTNKYIKIHKNNKFSGFIENDNIKQAHDYFIKWYGEDALIWLEQFRTIRNDTLELWATVDMAIQEIHKSGNEVSLKSIKDLIANDKEWKDKLNKLFFSDENIKSAIKKSKVLFG